MLETTSVRLLLGAWNEYVHFAVLVAVISHQFHFDIRAGDHACAVLVNNCLRLLWRAHKHKTVELFLLFGLIDRRNDFRRVNMAD